MPEGILETANGKIWYSVYGESQQKTPILVLHGGPGFMSMSEGLEPLWEDRPVYFYDQLGCGNRPGRKQGVLFGGKLCGRTCLGAGRFKT